MLNFHIVLYILELTCFRVTLKLLLFGVILPMNVQHKTHNNTAASAGKLGMLAADGRIKANHHFKFRAIGAVTAQLHGSFVARTIPEWNRLPAAAADAVSPTLFHSKLDALPANV